MEFDELDAGDYTVKVWASNGGEISGVGKNSVEVVAGESASCEITMKKAYSASAAASYIQELDGGDEYNVIVAGPVDDNAIAGIKSALAKKNNMNGTVALDLSWTTGLTEIAAVEDSGGAFEDCARLSSVVLPEGITAIWENSFANCSSLASINIPDSVTTIGESAFKNCTALSGIVLSEGIESILDDAFSGCESLASITIPDTVNEISFRAFQYCTALKSIKIPKNVTKIKIGCFRGCSALETVDIPENVTEIGSSAFSDCSALKKVDIPENVTEIPEEAFMNCIKLEIIYIPASVNTIGYQAFFGCSSLTTVNYGGNQESWGKISIDTNNDPVKNATKNYNYKGN